MDERTLGQPTALVVDDDTAVLRLLEEVLADEHYTVVSCSTGQAALHRLAEQSFDLLIADVGLPDLNGMAVCQAARERFGDDIVIVVITGDDQQQRVLTALALGADDFVSKPFNIDELIARLEAKLRRKP